MEQLCRLLTESITSLASDARELQVLSTVAKAASNGNIDGIAGRLRQLDQSLSAVEERVQLLADVVHEEKRSLQQVENQHEAALQHHEHLTSCAVLLQTPRLHHQQTILNQASRQQQQQPGDGLKTSSLWSAATPAVEDVVIDHHTTPSSATRQPHNLFPQNNTRRDSMDPRIASRMNNLLKLHLVTREELEAIPRTCRGRIALSVLNDALRDIAAICLKKQQGTNGFGSKEKPSFVLNTGHTAAASKENSTHDNCWFVVGEQELRQSCSFFRTGESTARSILLILRTLGRLKQVPAKTGDVTYVVGR